MISARDFSVAMRSSDVDRKSAMTLCRGASYTLCVLGLKIRISTTFLVWSWRTCWPGPSASLAAKCRFLASCATLCRAQNRRTITGGPCPRKTHKGLRRCHSGVRRCHSGDGQSVAIDVFFANEAEAERLVDEKFCRMWEFYLVGAETAFCYQNFEVFSGADH